MNELLLELVQVTLGRRTSLSRKPTAQEWEMLEAEAFRQGLGSFLADGIGRLADRPPRQTLLRWIGRTVQEEQRFAQQHQAETALAQQLAEAGLRVYVLKGAVAAECWPRPEHRRSVDLDCFLAGGADAWERGNRLMEENGFVVRRDFYKNSTWLLPALTVENHRFLTPFRGNERLKRLEQLLQRLLREGDGVSVFEGTALWRPPVMVSALFLVEHAYSHFLHEGLTWRHVLDGWFFAERHRSEIDWNRLDAWIDEFGFRRFYDSYERLGRLAVGLLSEAELTEQDRRMLADVWAPLDVHETVDGLRGKLALAGNTWRARWKYRLFTNMSWLRALWIQTRGVLFEREVGV